MNKEPTFTRADIWLFIAVSAYFIMNGAQFWETAIIVPAWTAAPPASLLFFQGTYGLDFKVFWIVIHSIHDVLFIIAILFNWRIRSRKIPLLFLFCIHAGIRAWTLLYFAPVITDFQHIPYSETINVALVERAANWRNLNYVRVGAFTIVNLSLIPLFKINTRQAGVTVKF